ncbi:MULTISPECIES: alkaline phosphatase [Intestinimonas]|uniref:alkaline phosphatase n=1 Tax=Intestinimonas TaxID=1392389 RepID=UPI00067F0E15|nr:MULTISPECIES: alkaline phosphatase [Intestinimonas]MDU1323812.1 alkaline phosphatase [Clostridiales bacterium]BDE88081.1 alkaline phosphatase [Oscillospiraceae bacterium]CUP29640.1 alkaline phosphatase 4 [Flavonifractor plautii]SCI92496.1 Alkaline phosphatase 4 precursor [uncultured Flavonifractor sp.]
MNFKRSLSLTLAALSLTGTLAACSANASAPQSQPPAVPAVSPLASVQTQEAKIPKYVFLFIGDGMSYPQFQAASDYLGALADTGSDDILDGNVPLTFMNFPVAGSAVTYDSSSFCPDSASTATSLSTGYKTYSGTINMDETATVSYETISEKLHAQLGWKVGVISSVNLNHATPAAFYAHQAKRSNYYEIGQELVASNFEYFAGGGLLKPTGPDKDKTSLYDLAADAGYKVVMTQAEAEAVTSADGKVLIIDEHLADSDAFAYENDRADGNWALSDYVKKGIEVLDNDTGFFLMVEGGKIDWACHANDAGSTIADTIALSDAVDEAVAFAQQHPDETLILVTGDHETGGLTIGYAGTDYDTFLTNLEHQKISYAKFDSDYVAKYKENNTSFDEVMKDVTALFGLKTEGAEDDTLVLTAYELDKLKAAYEATMDAGRADADPANQAEYVLYGSYEPLSVTITHILNNKSGVNFASYAHTGLPVAVFAQGSGQDLFEGFYDNTQVYHKLAGLLGVK